MTPTRHEEPVFAPGAILGDRFQIVRPVGSGGMGTVYEAIDRKLDRRVAVKCGRPGHHYRLTPEARAAREVSHFNVCKVHDIHTLDTPVGEIDCLSMEFVEGETLAHRIRTSGPLSPELARDIAGQIAAGLSQAHRQNVAHGDLKPGNVILARSPEGRIRAVITDFGLARITDEVRADTVAGGTYDYMAPESYLGEPPSVAADLYAFGVILHEMLTGRVPQWRQHLPERPDTWTPGSDQLTRVAPDRMIIPSEWRRETDPLPAPWNKIVHDCLAARPRERPASAQEIGKRLIPRRLLLKSLAAVLCVAALLVAGNRWRSAPPLTPVRLAILPFIVEGGTSKVASAIGFDVAERLAGARSKFTVISPQEAEKNHGATPKAAHARLGATHALETHIRIVNGTWTTTASVVDLTNDRAVGQPLQGTYSEAEVPLLAKALVGTVSQAFHLTGKASRETVNAAAYPYYVQAVDLLHSDHSNVDLAIPLFDKASKLDAQSALPYAGLAEAQIQRIESGDQARLDSAEKNAAKAAAISPDSVPVLLASSFVQQERGRYEPAIQLLTRATEIAPSDPEPLRRLALCYERAGRLDDALAAYQRAIQAKPDYYRPYLTLGTFYFNRGQFARAEEEYRHALAAAPGLESGHMNLGLVLMQQRKYPEAEAQLLEALELAQDPKPGSNLLLNLGSLYYAEGNFGKAADYYGRSLAAGSPTTTLLRNLGDANRQLGRTADAREAYKRARSLAEADVRQNPRRAASHSVLGLLDAFLGDPQPARFELSQALALGPETRSVMRDAAIAYEHMGLHDEALAAIKSAPRSVLEEMAHQPDLKGLAQDSRFQNLLSNAPAQ